MRTLLDVVCLPFFAPCPRSIDLHGEHPILFWNLAWHLTRAGLPLDNEPVRQAPGWPEKAAYAVRSLVIGAGGVFSLLPMTMTGCAAFDRKSPGPPRRGPSVNTLGRSLTRATPLQGSGKAAPTYWSHGRTMRVHVETHGLRPRLTRTPVCIARTTTPLPPPNSVCQYACHAAYKATSCRAWRSLGGERLSGLYPVSDGLQAVNGFKGLSVRAYS
jgi:hypothetical protein